MNRSRHPKAATAILFWRWSATPPAEPTGPVEGEKQKDVCDKTGQGYTLLWQAQTATANQIAAMK